jgi:CheY-like chemotaxis protein
MTDQVEKAAEFIYVEDNESDQMIVKKICQKFCDRTPVCFSNGLEFFDYLGQFGLVEQLPHLILLDLNMPSMNGYEVIETLKNHDLYKYIPVVVLSSSDSQKDIDLCYRHHVNAYICKKLDFNDYKEGIESTLDFWLKAVYRL